MEASRSPTRIMVCRNRMLLSPLSAPRSIVFERDLDPLVRSALALVSGHPQPPHLAGVAHVDAAVGLKVETLDLEHPNLRDPGRQQIRVLEIEGLDLQADGGI